MTEGNAVATDARAPYGNRADCYWCTGIFLQRFSSRQFSIGEGSPLVCYSDEAFQHGKECVVIRSNFMWAVRVTCSLRGRAVVPNSAEHQEGSTRSKANGYAHCPLVCARILPKFVLTVIVTDLRKNTPCWSLTEIWIPFQYRSSRAFTHLHFLRLQFSLCSQKRCTARDAEFCIAFHIGTPMCEVCFHVGEISSNDQQNADF